ncbi:Leucine-rich repeat receptor-like protein kinase pxl1 [Thalictrum thalictroides]|uniref:Leucine-rich repeat receptor-like protein kinase pxl1 n=1 Tax=Thalictrum thalictroides TaxID=46969 RepID=A0A7J6WHM0_THATH|nr:Leucine-rich repeat receptor-like protein kinase pxl1 [Thalictrum thalictroides]
MKVIQKFKGTITSDPLGITKTWVGSDVCGNYKGFFCDTPPDNHSATAVASIDFNGFQLGAPTLQGFLDELPDLALFHANSNNFSGTIPDKILKLPYLYELDISNNKFSGAFPSVLLFPNNITFLDIRFNFFSGSVPSQIFSRQLDVLFINNNNFKAKLPANFGNTPVLFLSLANNKLTGQIPSSIGKASSLIEILFLNNQLSGCLPYEIGYLKGLTLFDVGNNRLTGPLPCSFACLDKLEQLNLAGNFFYGPVPEVVCALGNLENFTLSGNYFTEVGPICRNLISRGILNLKNNCVLDLPFQRSPIDCAMFFSRPRWCPFLQSYYTIPCKPSHSPRASTRQSKAPPLTHSSLIKHRL